MQKIKIDNEYATKSLFFFCCRCQLFSLRKNPLGSVKVFIVCWTSACRPSQSIALSYCHASATATTTSATIAAKITKTTRATMVAALPFEMLPFFVLTKIKLFLDMPGHCHCLVLHSSRCCPKLVPPKAAAFICSPHLIFFFNCLTKQKWVQIVEFCILDKDLVCKFTED